jgi:hypothetical protein
MGQKLKMTRKHPVQGVPAPHDDPCRYEMDNLEGATPKALVAASVSYLSGLGVQKKCELGPNPAMLLLGEPEEVNGVIVSKLLNSELKGWEGEPPEDNGIYNSTSTTPGYYSGDPLQGPRYIHSKKDGEDFFNNITACVITGGILFNTHQPGFSCAPYHEILHTFEGRNLVGITDVKEGFVEYFSLKMAKQRFGMSFDVFAGYANYVRELSPLLAYAGDAVCAQAYFGDDTAALCGLMPQIFEPTRAAIPAKSAISKAMAAKIINGSQTVKDYVPKGYNMTAKGKWYVEWCDQHNGGKAPPDGPAPKKASVQGLPSGGLPPGKVPPLPPF